MCTQSVTGTDTSQFAPYRRRMSYVHRDERPAFHHVVTRGNNQRRIFENDDDRWFFCITVDRIAKKYGWTVLAYCLMDNHYHLVLSIGELGLADGMCELNTAYARNYNARHGRINHLFGKRYWNRYLRTHATVVNASCRTRAAPAGHCRSRHMSGRATGRRSASRTPACASTGTRCCSSSDRRRSGRSRSTARTARPLPSGAMSGGSRREQQRASESRKCVFGAAAAFRRRQAAAFRGDRAALDAVRRGELDLDRSLAVLLADLVDLRGAEVHPHLRQLARDLRLDADVVRLVVARSVARREDARELVEGDLPVGRRIRLRAVGLDQRLLRVALRALVARREPSLRRSHRARHRAADVEPATERLAHVPHFAQVAPDERVAQRLVVGREDGALRAAALERPPRRLGGESPRLDRVVDALERRHIHETDTVARQQEARRVEALRQRDEPTLGDRLRAPLHALAAVENPPDPRMQLELLQQVVHRQLRVGVVEPDDEADRDHVVPHRVDERPAELAELLPRAKGPPHRVDDAVERTRHLPDLLHAQRPHLRVVAAQPEPIERSAGQVTLRPLGEDRYARREVGARLEVRQLLATPAASAVAGAHAEHAAAVDEQLVARRLGQDRRAERLRLVREEARQLRERCDVVAVVDHRRRRREAERTMLRHEEHGLGFDGLVERQLVHSLSALEETLQAARVDDRAREDVRPRRLALLEHGHRHVAEPLRLLGILLQQLTEANRAGEPGRPGADDQEPDLDPLVQRIGRRLNRLRRRKRRRKVGGPDAHAAFRQPLRARTSSVSFGTISCRSPTTPRSENSKIGAFGSLLIATITLDPCMPTLCWIAPEIPSATYSFGDTVLPVCPTCAAYGYQPASTTARVAATAPPSACASSSASENFSGSPSPRPPATITSASSIDGPCCSACACSTISACVEKSSSATTASFTSTLPPVSTASSAPARKMPSLTALDQPTSTTTVSCSCGALPVSPSKSTRPQLRPASSRAESPAAMSAARTDCAKRTVSNPSSATSFASTSTRGCGNGAASDPSSATQTVCAP